MRRTMSKQHASEFKNLQRECAARQPISIALLMRCWSGFILCLPFFLCAHTATCHRADNGITVGQPKIFDNRALQLMLDSLNQQLQSAQFLNQAAISSALGVLQGSESSDVTRNLSLS